MELLSKNTTIAEVAVQWSFRGVWEAVGAELPAGLEYIRKNIACSATVRPHHLYEIADKVQCEINCKNEVEKRVWIEDRRGSDRDNLFLVCLMSGDKATSDGRTEDDVRKIIHELGDNYYHHKSDNKNIGKSLRRVLRQIKECHF